MANPTPHIDQRLRQALPDLAVDEERALKASIATFGVLDPVKISPDGTILDGHHRFEIAASLGIDVPVKVLDISDPDDQLEFAVTANFARRNLTSEQKYEVVEVLRERGLSVRAIARMTGIPKSTVGNIVRPISDTPPAPADMTADQLADRIGELQSEKADDGTFAIPASIEDAVEYLNGPGSELAVLTSEAMSRAKWHLGQSVLADFGHIPSDAEIADMYQESPDLSDEIPSSHLAVLTEVVSLFPLDSHGRRPMGKHLGDLAIGAPEQIRHWLGRSFEE